MLMDAFKKSAPQGAPKRTPHDYPPWTKKDYKLLEERANLLGYKSEIPIPRGQLKLLARVLADDPEIRQSRGYTPTECAMRHVVRKVFKMEEAKARPQGVRRSGNTLVILLDGAFKGEWPISQEEAQSIVMELSQRVLPK